MPPYSMAAKKKMQKEAAEEPAEAAAVSSTQQPSDGGGSHASYNMAHNQKMKKQRMATGRQMLPDIGTLNVVGVFNIAQYAKRVQSAKRHIELKRVVKKQIVDASHPTPYRMGGKHMIVTPFNLKDKTASLSDYGCPLAVHLYLRFHKECIVLFLLMFALSIPDMVSNASRVAVRDECRQLTSNATLYAAVTAAAPQDASSSSSSSSSLLPAGLECGWSGVSVRANLSAIAPWYLRVALGTCQEFSSASNALQPIEPGPNGADVYLTTPKAHYCTQPTSTLAAAKFWFQFVNCVLFFAFLLRIRRMQRQAARQLDRQRWTASDYTVLVKGLDRNVFADDQPDANGVRTELGLETRVYQDLARAGFPRDRIVQVEVGRECKEEMSDVRAYYNLKVEEQEVHTRVGGRSKLSAATKRKLEALAERRRGIVAELDEHRREPDVATGHAFIVFNYEADRNKLLELCNPSGLCTPKSLGFVLPSWLATDPRFDWESAMERTHAEAPGKRPVVGVAPEPDDVMWENLSINDAERSKQVAKVTGVTIVLLVLGAVVNTAATVFAANIEVSGTPAFPVPSGATPEQRQAILDGFRISFGTSIALIPVAVNMVLRAVVSKMILTEGHDTTTEFETSIFAKLSLAYILNSVLIPIATAMYFSLHVGARPVTQEWYEAGGVVQKAFSLMLSNALVTDALKVVQFASLFSRYCLSRFALSHEKFQTLWEPPDMNLGELYAASLRTISLCLLYSPLWPPAYLITAGAMAITFWATKFAVAKWYKKPPMVSEEMMDTMRSRLAQLMLLHTVVAAMGANAAAADAVRTQAWNLGAAATTPIVAMFALWLLYEMLDAPGCLKMCPGLGDYDAADDDGKYDGVSGALTQLPYKTFIDPATGETHKGVEDTMGYEIDEYVCPTAREDGKYTTEELIDIVLRDFADDPEAEGGAGADGTIELKRIGKQPSHKPHSMAHRQYAQPYSAAELDAQSAI
jgi:hypothetical protein